VKIFPKKEKREKKKCGKGIIIYLIRYSSIFLKEKKSLDFQEI